MARADAMYRAHYKFVRKRLWAELLPYMLGRTYEHFYDLETDVWMAVASKIDKYSEQINPATGKAMPLAWLRVIVHSTVIDHFRTSYREKRDVRLTDQQIDDNNLIFSMPQWSHDELWEAWSSTEGQPISSARHYSESLKRIAALLKIARRDGGFWSDARYVAGQAQGA